MKIKLATIHPAGMHKAVITSIVEEETQFGPGLKFGMVTDDGVLSVLTSTTYSAKSKLGKLAAAVLGDRPEDLDTDDLKGRQLMVMVEHEEKGGAVWDKVTAFAPYKEGARADPFTDA